MNDRKRPTVFIQANGRQLLGAQVAAYALRYASPHRAAFDVEIMHADAHEFLAAREGQPYRRAGGTRLWRNDDLQSFTPLRFLPPALMGYAGRALVIDPDIFAVGDVYELLARDMQDKAILCQRRPGHRGFDSSVMLLDCARLRHWDAPRDFDALFTGARDYYEWMHLLYEPEDSIALFERGWNSLDRLDENTRLLHNTRRRTQPWKTGLPIEFTPGDKYQGWPLLHGAIRTVRHLFAGSAFVSRYRKHPDARQEALFFSLLRGALEDGCIDEAFVHEQVARQYLRSDVWVCLAAASPPVIPAV